MGGKQEWRRGYSSICSFFHSTTFTHFPIVTVSNIVYVDSIFGFYLMHIKILISNGMDSEVGGRGGN